MKYAMSAVTASCLLAFANQSLAAEAPKNIIYMIGDGMGPAFTTAYRYYSDNPNTKLVEPTIFDQILVGMAHTYPDDDTYVTDSAAGATALSTAIKTYNGAIAVDTHKKPLKTMLQVAKEKGMRTGLVSTSQINHATPASFAAHNESRRNYDEIADDYFDVKIAGKLPVDLMLGGGVQYFKRSDRDLIKEFEKAGYQYTSDWQKLNQIEQLPALGLFADKAFPHAIDENPNRLEKMTFKSLDLISKNNDKGFFIMLEGSQIDWCGHANDIACAMKEMHDFAKSIELAKAYVDQNPDTLLVVTADHSTGGLTLGANGKYTWLPDEVKKVNSSVMTMTKSLLEADDLKTAWNQHTSLALSKDALDSLSKAKQDGDEALYKAINKVINTATYTGWTTSGHTAIDVQVFAYGKGYEQFIGSQNNTQIAEKLINFIEK
ncbi:alkaline phosphatase [Pseudoalteromonas phenolica]|uniref:Alkaline phosphatase n=1 Tax=Pseudoalteromonas phenolica TaxID=161398 RepID=A0A0S2K8W0_9GAMM|nr:alkaline phosphatase [Pseudoalteromonas phenolica]ALO44665.1 Alkaline phosphatase [Pseudoalteromonas phenolica]MBE0357699.1 alkaline phosphatase [Pseudoalteromonas phenolica O-BC30]RXF02385.1 alkaline phosphatase [Pseudoalteromonas phenolica O-BC30]